MHVPVGTARRVLQHSALLIKICPGYGIFPR